MLHGAAVAAAAAGGLAELIEHDKTGLLSPPGDTAALAESVVSLLTDAGLARRLGQGAAAYVRQGHSWDRVLPGLLAVYDEARADPLAIRRRGR
jgi:glycosyltransferase involved in cell wall biosynthesis